MPEIGEVKDGLQVGYKWRGKVIWHACVDCGKERWVSLINLGNLGGEPESVRCHLCHCRCRTSNQNGENNPSWKGGRRKTEEGYILILLSPDDFFYPMAGKNGCVLEHRLVMAKSLGRNLQRWELVHHKGIRYTGNENRSDNLIDNLELTMRANHSREHNKGYRDGYRKGLYDGRNKQIEELRQEIKLLQWQLREVKV